MARKAKNLHFDARLGGLLLFCVLLLGSCAQGGGGDQVEFGAVLNGVDISTSRPNDPIALLDAETADLELTMTNVSADPVVVRFVRFEGQVLDMIFLTYDTSVRVELAPGQTSALPPVLLDFYDLGGQATGYLRGHVQLYDNDRALVGSEPVFLHADGGGSSTLARFNILLLVGTLAGIGWNLFRLAQRKLPSNRFVRAVRFLALGAGVGLTLAVAFSTLSLWPLDTMAWVLMTVIAAIIGYAVGFVLPGADDDVIDILDEQDVLDAVLDEQVDHAVSASGQRATAKLD